MITMITMIIIITKSLSASTIQIGIGTIERITNGIGKIKTINGIPKTIINGILTKTITNGIGKEGVIRKRTITK